MKYFFVFCFLFFCNLKASSPVFCAIVSDMKTGKVFYEKNSTKKMQPASLAKMMTLLLTFKALRENKIKPNTLIRFSKKAAGQSPSKLGEYVGRKISVRQAILALITKSANDVAVALAEHVGGSEKQFVKMMNKEARDLKMFSTHFENSSGLHNSKQLTTARDMLRLSRVLLTKYSGYYHLFSTKKFLYKNKYLYNHNKLLGKKNGIIIDGIKTGFVNASGFNLAASAKKGNQRLIVVVLGGVSSKYRDKCVAELFKKGFNKQLKKESLFLAKLENRKEKPVSYLKNYEMSNGKMGIYNKLKAKSFGVKE